MTARVDFSREEIAGKRLRLLAALAEMPPSRVLSILIENAPPPDQLRTMAAKNESGASTVVETPATAL